jgi:hypothetical protein
MQRTLAQKNSSAHHAVRSLSEWHTIVDAGDMTAVTHVSTPPEPTGKPDRAALLARLKSDAEYLRPEMFAVHGISHAVHSLLPERPFLGWGIDFGEEWGAIFWNPLEHTTQISDSAEQILKSHQRTAEAYLTWLD